VKIIKAYKFRLYPTSAHECLFSKTFGCGRLVYNTLLNQYNTEKTFKAVLAQEKLLKKLYPFLKEVDSIALQQARINLRFAINNIFNKNTKAKNLKFKSRKSKQSYRTVSTNNNIKINFETAKLTLPKIGEVSNNKKRQRKKVARIHEKIKNKRADFLHKLSDSITKNYSAVGVENLNISGILKNHRLAKSVSDGAWGIFLKQLEYKSALRGVYFVKVDRFFPSSKLCNNCDFKNNDLDLSMRSWTCPHCGEVLDRDINTAKNIKKEILSTLGIRGIYACGDSLRPRSRSVKSRTKAESFVARSPTR